MLAIFVFAISCFTVLNTWAADGNAYIQPTTDLECSTMADLAANALVWSPLDRQSWAQHLGNFLGAAEQIKNLHCFVGHQKCACMVNAFDLARPASGRMLDALFDVLYGCDLYNGGLGLDPTRSVSGVGLEAISVACP